MTERRIKILENPSELGAGTRGSSLGPAAVRLADAARGSRIYNRIPMGMLFEENEALHETIQFPNARHIDTLLNVLTKNCAVLERYIGEGYFPLIISGDHSNAISSIAAVANHYRKERTGVIWIDAHADLHSPYTTPSGNVHGMSLGAALGEGYRSETVNEVAPEVVETWTALTELGDSNHVPKIQPSDLYFIDIRDLEKQEWADIHDNSIRYRGPAELKGASMTEVASDALEALSHCHKIYVSFDVDVMDPTVSEGTGTSVPNGLHLDQAKELLGALWNSDKLAALEITEINPLLDTENRMAMAVVDILDSLLS